MLISVHFFTEASSIRVRFKGSPGRKQTVTTMMLAGFTSLMSAQLHIFLCWGMWRAGIRQKSRSLPVSESH
jgi:hypothetical protein